jgi:SAM-dependent methyltransferase
MGMLTREMPRLELLIASDTWLPYLDTLRTLGRPDIAVMQIDVRGLAPRTQEIRSLALDAVYSSNLLEHLEDDVDALRHMRRVVREDGRVVAFVPALRKLYGRHDQAVGHYRRYERRELKEKMQAAGLAVERLRYFNLPGVLAWSIINRRSGQVRSADLRFFSKFIPLFRTLERLLPPPVGLSLIAVGRNVEDPSRPSLSSPW